MNCKLTVITAIASASLAACGPDLSSDGNEKSSTAPAPVQQAAPNPDGATVQAVQQAAAPATGEDRSAEAARSPAGEERGAAATQDKPHDTEQAVKKAD